MSKAGQKEGRASVSLQASTHIVKLWEQNEFPELAANEFFCLQAAQRAGLNVPMHELSETGEALIVERFDVAVAPLDNPNQGRGVYRGFEDFCVLNGVNTQDKYRGSYESNLFKRLMDYTAPISAHEDLRSLFKLFVLNVIVRNGDAHLKNFGMLYDNLSGPVRLAPVYDIVTTTAYIPQDTMALTLNGSTRWPDRASLQRLGAAFCELSSSQSGQIINEVSQAVTDTREQARFYYAECPTPEVGNEQMKAWEQGLTGVMPS